MDEEDIKRMRRRLKTELPKEKRPTSEAMAVVKALIKEISAYQAKGFTLRQIFEVLSKDFPDDVEMKFNTFAIYVRKAKKDQPNIESLGRGRPKKVKHGRQ